MRAARGCARRTRASIASAGHAAIPSRGPLAANTVAGAVSGWSAALDIAPAGKLPLARLLEDAIEYARDGIAGHAEPGRLHRQSSCDELAPQPGFAETFLRDGASADGAIVPAVPGARSDAANGWRSAGSTISTAATLAHAIAAELARLGSPLRLDDLQQHAPRS